MLDDQLIVTWGQICQAMRTDFEPYLAVVIPPLFKVLAIGKFIFNTAGVLLITTTETSRENHLQGLMTRYLQKGLMGAISTDNQRQAFQSLVIYCTTLKSRFAPYVPQSLELTLSALRLSIGIKFQDECISWVFISRPCISCH
jgi:hypothetical protein